MNLTERGLAGKGGRRRSLAAAPSVDPGEVGPLDNMLPACAVHPVPLELRRLVEGISSGPDDSREHGREQDQFFCCALRHVPTATGVPRRGGRQVNRMTAVAGIGHVYFI
jgi:hypothetical protein